MVRIQLHLTDEQERRLRAMAKKLGASRAELIRRGVDLLLQHYHPGRDPLLDLIGAAGPAGRRDGSERHDEIVYRRDGEDRGQ
jgi:Arc/MetJ-type ribon-helix-helix transcriptional regulator